jgi:hypothetical protein
MRLTYLYWMLFALLVTVIPVTAQDSPQVISADNIRQLQSVTRIDWQDWTPEVDRGTVSLNPTGNLVAVMDRGQNLVTLDSATGAKLDSYSVTGTDGLPTTLLDAAFSADSQYQVSIHSEGGAYYVAYRPIGAEVPIVRRVVTQDVPLRVWANEYVWLEVAGSDLNSERYVLRTDFPLTYDVPLQTVNAADWQKIPSGPENDPDSFLRVGRIIPPLAITVTQEGLIKRWNLETGEVTAQAQLDTLPAAGQVNSDRRYLAWADQQFEGLHLLDFETGEDRVIALLQGANIPYILLSAEADVIIGVNVGLEPIVVAWDVPTGERIDLGEYRPCNRQPDMVRLSKDGTTLVVGCDTGLDIWRVK